jgi:GAF domain-containing protein
MLDGRTVHVADLQSGVDEFPEGSANARRLGFRAALSVPLMREGVAIGAIAILRAETLPFTERQIALLETFADQAVIAIENVRLFNELQERTHELTRSVDELRALGEVGQAVSSSLDLETVLNTIIARAVEISSAHGGIIYEYDEAKQEFRLIRGSHRLDEELGQVIRAAPIRLGEGVAGKAAALRAPVQIPDILDERTYDVARTRAVFERRGYRSLLAVPLLIEQRIIGVLVVWRQEPGSFGQEVVNLLQTFAAQSVLAIQNARLFLEIDEKSRALEELSRNQQQLYRLSTALQEPLSLSEQLTRVLDAARQVVGLDRIYVWTLGPDGAWLMVTAQAGFEERDWHDLAGVAIPIGEAGALAAVCRDGVPLRFTEDNPLPAHYRLRPPYSTLAGLRVKSFLVIPMIARGRTVGVLAADNRTAACPFPSTRWTCSRPSPPTRPSPSRTPGCSRRSRNRVESSSSRASTRRSSWPT